MVSIVSMANRMDTMDTMDTMDMPVPRPCLAKLWMPLHDDVVLAHSAARSTMLVLLPPKPYEFDSTVRSGTARLSFGT